MTGTDSYVLLAGAVIVVVLVVYVAFTLLHSYRVRRLGALRGEAAGPQAAADRAYNRLALARREADLLEAQGGDVARARQLIALSQRSQETGAYDRAYELAQAAHETLVQARREPRHPGEPNAAAAETTPSAAGPLATGPAPRAESAVPPPPPVPKNRAEAQFELRLFEQDLVKAKKSAPRAVATKEASELYVLAHAAFGRAEYAEAFRLSLRGRRRVGGTVESLGPSTATPVVPGGSGSDAPIDPARTAEEVAAQDRCPLCGHPTVPGDAFCRGCGAARTPLVCPKCGAARKPTDTFCGKCGQRYG